MSTVLDPQPSPTPEKEDPWRLGWRYVRHEGPDGLVGYERVPLRQEDLLHPQEDDFIVTNDAHGRDCTYLRNVFEAWAAGKEGALVLADTRVDWQAASVEPHGPDLAVFQGVRDWNPTDGTFTVVDHGARPLLVVEVTSPSTRDNDLDDKVVEYHRAGVPFYGIVDRRVGGQGLEGRLLGYRANHEAYVRLPLDERGRMWLEPVGLWLAFEGGRAVCYDEQGKHGRNMRWRCERSRSPSAGRRRGRRPADRRDAGRRRGRCTTPSRDAGRRGRGPDPRVRGQVATPARRGRPPEPRRPVSASVGRQTFFALFCDKDGEAMATELPKQYDPKEAQQRWLSFWDERGYFHSEPDPNRQPFCIVIPPPNVTRPAHGPRAQQHASRRSHSLATDARVQRPVDARHRPRRHRHAGRGGARLRNEEKKTRHDLGREEFVRIWQWKEQYEKRILGQLKELGCSCDWRARASPWTRCAPAVRTTSSACSATA